MLVFAVAASAACWAQQSRAVANVVDRSPVATGLLVSGTVSFSDELVGNQLIATCSNDVSVRNATGKPILLLIVSLASRGPYAACPDATFQLDQYFSDAIPADGRFSVFKTRPGSARRTVFSPYVPERMAKEPNAELRVLYIQFSDGSSVGDQGGAAGMLARRAALRGALNRLNEAYTSQGPEAFVTLLYTRLSNDPTHVSFFQGIREMEAKQGPEAAAEYVRKLLQSARHNQAALDATHVAMR